MVITTQINTPIVTIDFVPTPTQMMINGPRAIFGKLFKITKYGSKTRLANFVENKMIAAINPNMVLSRNAYIVSVSVVVTWSVRDPDSIKSLV